MKSRLAYCENLDEAAEWCLAKMRAGDTLVDPGIFSAGFEGTQIMRRLRKQGHRVKTVYVSVEDCGGTIHPRTLAWRLEG